MAKNVRAEIVDVSHWQYFLNPHAKEFSLGIVKVSEGEANFLDENQYSGDDWKKKVKATRQMCEAVHEFNRRGFYNYLRRTVPWQKQRDTFLEANEGLQSDVDINDMEKGNNDLYLPSGEPNRSHFDQFLNIAYEYTKSLKAEGRKVLQYMNSSFYFDAVKKMGHTWLQKEDIWMARYWFDHWDEVLRDIPTDTTIKIPRLFDGKIPWGWQYTDKYPGKKEGITGSDSMDASVFNGSWVKLEMWFGIKSLQSYYRHKKARRYLPR